MKILMISSAGLGIYPSIEKSIMETFLKLNHSIHIINPVYSLETVKIINDMEPDLVITMVGQIMDLKLIEFLKKKKLILCIWLTEDPFYIDDTVKLINDYDYIFTVDLGAFEYYKKRFPTKPIFHLPLGTDPSIYFQTEPSHHLYDLCLVGYPYPERIELVHYILNHTPYTMILAGPLWKGFIQDETHINKLVIINKWIEPSFVREIFNSSKIILNPHRSHKFYKNKNSLNVESKSINNRTFDIAACGGFQLISEKPDIGIHFDRSSEMVSYSNKEECLHLIRHYISDEKIRKQYSKNAQRKALSDHTFFHRAQFILDRVHF
ncbi:CgeB family protein [Bacillus litorisediminis]|uniref:CgeB family protein n=1 Tax=Bacillus litorisediminis TaxID=2922713 RepID=UPI001FAB38AB|nr:glycosyltransferase [Bacillus litorisediminis]